MPPGRVRINHRIYLRFHCSSFSCLQKGLPLTHTLQAVKIDFAVDPVKIYLLWLRLCVNRLRKLSNTRMTLSKAGKQSLWLISHQLWPKCPKRQVYQLKHQWSYVNIDTTSCNPLEKLLHSNNSYSKQGWERTSRVPSLATGSLGKVASFFSRFIPSCQFNDVWTERGRREMDWPCLEPRSSVQ